MRQLVTIRTVSELIPIEGADVIELAKVDGWQCVVKKGDFKVGDQGVYFEIDSMIPSDDLRFKFLDKGKVQSHYRIKSMRLRKALSQGLLMPRSIITYKDEARSRMQVNGEALETWTDIFGVQKYEPPVPIAGVQKGTFPTHIVPKTDQERIQNIAEILTNDFFADRVWEVTEKLDGTSCTFFYFNEPDADLHGDVPAEMTAKMGACSRNWEMKLDDENVYAQLFKKLELGPKLSKLNRNLAIQGEIIGGRIQGNKYQRGEQEFSAFDVYDIDNQCHWTPAARRELCQELGLLHVPVLDEAAHCAIHLDDMLKLAEGHSVLHATQREGVVYKAYGKNFSFKVISNKFLLKHE
jgi:RNA ligase (TIGR02306 family)